MSGAGITDGEAYAMLVTDAPSFLQAPWDGRFPLSKIQQTGAGCRGVAYSRGSQGRVRGVQRRSLPTPSHAPTDVAAVSGHTPAKVRLLTLGVLGAAVALAGCGSVSSAPEEPTAKAMQLSVEPMRFSSTKQLPGDRTTLSLRVTNTGANPVDNLIVTLSGTRPDQLPVRGIDNANEIPQGTTDLPNTIKRKAWFIDDGPNRNPLAGGEQWTGGRLEPGQSTVLRWKLAAITPGRYTLKYIVAGGLTDKAVKATSGTGLTGSVTATIAEPSEDDPAT